MGGGTLLEYACDKCGVIELVSSPMASPFHCVCCQGKPWHNLYEKVVYDPAKHQVENRPSGVGLG